MASILQPFSKRSPPNETGTISVYASVNERGGARALSDEYYTRDEADETFLSKTEAAVTYLPRTESLFAVADGCAVPNADLNLAAPSVKVTSTAAIDDDNENAVNKEYADGKYLAILNSTGLRRMVWSGDNILVQQRSSGSTTWNDRFKVYAGSSAAGSGISASKLYLNTSAAGSGASVTGIATSSTTAASTSDALIATPGYISTFYLTKAEAATNYLAKTDTAANAAKIEWTYSGNTYKLEPESSSSNALILSNNGTTEIKFRASTGNIMIGGSLYPQGIRFGFDANGNTNTNSWYGTVTNLANSTYLAGVAAGTSKFVNANKDELVPTYKTLTDNYYTKTEIDSMLSTRSAAIANTYQTISDSTANDLKISDASTTYLTKTAAASTYLTQNDMSGYLTQNDASTTYLPMANAAGIRRLRWDGNTLVFETRNSTSADYNEITTKVYVGDAYDTSAVATPKLYLNARSANTGEPYVSGILTSSSLLSTRDNAIATPGYIYERYITRNEASETYLSKTSASSTYLTKTAAANTYLTSSDMSTYLTKTAAASTYAAKSSVEHSRVTNFDFSSEITGLSSTLTTFRGGEEYVVQAAELIVANSNLSSDHSSRVMKLHTRIRVDMVAYEQALLLSNLDVFIRVACVASPISQTRLEEIVPVEVHRTYGDTDVNGTPFFHTLLTINKTFIPQYDASDHYYVSVYLVNSGLGGDKNITADYGFDTDYETHELRVVDTIVGSTVS